MRSERRKINQIFNPFGQNSQVVIYQLKIIPIFWVLLGLAGVQSTSATAQCRLCSQPSTSVTNVTRGKLPIEKPLRIEVTTNLDFSRIAMLNHAGGEVDIDPVSGHRRVSGSITNLGGMSLNGEGRLFGEPGRLVRVSLPERITLSASNGSTAELVKLETNLPVQARLDRDGRLNFAFGGRLRVTGNAGGQYRGRIAITADYE